MRRPHTPLPWRGWVVPAALLLAAEAALHGAQRDALAPPSAALRSLWQALWDGSLWQASWQTLGAAAGGLALGGSLGLVMGLWLGLSRRAANAAALCVELLRPLPSVALIPVALLAFGFGWRLEMAVVAFSCFFPMLILTQTAVRSVEPRLLEVAQVLGFGPAQRATKIVVPAALPRVFVGLRLCVGIALVVSVTTEIASNPQGLGYAMLTAQQNLAPERMLALLLWVGLLGWASNALLLALQQRWFGAAAPNPQGAQP